MRPLRFSVYQVYSGLILLFVLALPTAAAQDPKDKPKEDPKARPWLLLGMSRAAHPFERFQFLRDVASRHPKDKAGLAAQVQIVWLILDDAAKRFKPDTIVTALVTFAQLEEASADLDRALSDWPDLRAEAAYHRAVIREFRAILDFLDLKGTPEMMKRIDPEGLQGKCLKTAQELFERVAKDFKDSAHATLARKRLKTAYADDKAIEALQLKYKRLCLSSRLEEQIILAEIRLRPTKDDD